MKKKRKRASGFLTGVLLLVLLLGVGIQLYRMQEQLKTARAEEEALAREGAGSLAVLGGAVGAKRCYIDVLALDLEQALDAAARLLTPPQCAGAGFAPFRPKAKGTPLAKTQ